MTEIPMMTFLVPCGFPSPAADSSEEHINLTSYLVRHPYSTCCVRAAGTSMTGAGILDGDILVVDRQVRPKDGDIVLAVYDGGFLAKRLLLRGGKAILHAENPAYKDIVVENADELVITGVVIGVVRKFHR